MPRDPKAQAITNMLAKMATSQKAKQADVEARDVWREAMLLAVEAGVSRGEIARQCGTSESRIRQYVMQAGANRAAKSR